MQSYRGQDSFYGFTNVPWISVNRAYERLEQFVLTPANLVAAEQSRITGSEYLHEEVTAAYAQVETRLWHNRLTLLGGARFERTRDSGQGPWVDLAAVYVRNANGTFARDAQGNRLRKAEAGAAGSLPDPIGHLLERIVARCAALKAAVVTRDELPTALSQNQARHHVAALVGAEIMPATVVWRNGKRRVSVVSKR